jgi:hypothetical protein
MDAIYKFKSVKLATTEGVFSEEMDKAIIKKRLLKIIKSGTLTGTLINEEGDTDETESAVDVSKAHAIILCAGEEYFKVLKHSPQMDSEEDEEQTIHLIDVHEEGDWLLGKSLKRLNAVKVNSDEYVAIKKSEVEVLPINADNYIDSHMSWIFDQLLTDFEDRYGNNADAEDVEVDDGD